jgi:hypothetical protein
VLSSGGEGMKDLREDFEDDVELFATFLGWTDAVSLAMMLTVLVLLFWWWLW